MDVRLCSTKLIVFKDRMRITPTCMLDTAEQRTTCPGAVAVQNLRAKMEAFADVQDPLHGSVFRMPAISVAGSLKLLCSDIPCLAPYTKLE